jgi:hypothetical protein
MVNSFQTSHVRPLPHIPVSQKVKILMKSINSLKEEIAALKVRMHACM